MSSSEASQRYVEDQSVLEKIGAHMNAPGQFVTVRIPVELADLPVAAWQRDELDDPAEESDAERLVRHRWATLALIGLGIEERGVRDGDVVVVSLPAETVADALACVADLDSKR